MSDFKAPDVLYTDKASLVLANAKGHTSLGLMVTNSATAHLFSYTFTTTAEANTRKAVREVLESIAPLTEGSYKVLDNHIEQLLTQYKDPQPTPESNNDQT